MEELVSPDRCLLMKQEIGYLLRLATSCNKAQPDRSDSWSYLATNECHSYLPKLGHSLEILWLFVL